MRPNQRGFVEFIVLIMIVGFLGAALWVALTPPEHGLTPGQCVQMKMDGLRGTVTDATHRSVWVRFSAKTDRTNSHLFGSDGDIERKPYATVIVKPFELEPCR